MKHISALFLLLFTTAMTAFAAAPAPGPVVRSMNGASTNQILVGTVRVPEGAAVGKVLMGTNANGALTWSSDTLTNITATVLSNTIFAQQTFFPQILLNPPHIGPSMNKGAYAANNSAGMIFTGKGIIRELWLSAELGHTGGLNTNIANLRLEIFTDGGNTTNLAFRNVDVNLADLFGNRFRFLTNGDWAIDRDSRGIQSQDRSTNATYGGYFKTLQLKLPIAFSNGCLVRITNAATGALYQGGILSATHEQAASLDALGYLQHWRLRSRSVEGAATGAASNFLFSAAGPGLCVGWLQALHDPDVTKIEVFVDSIAPAFRTSADTEWQVTGWDDFFLSTYAMKAGVTLGYNSGIINFKATGSRPTAVEAYRWFFNDAIYWTNGVTIYIPDGQQIASMSSTMFFYAP